MDRLGPYRGAPARPRFVCVACYRWTSPTPATCPWCEVELIDLSRTDVREDLRHELARRYEERRDRRETGRVVIAAWCGLVSALLAGVLVVGWSQSVAAHLVAMMMVGLAGGALAHGALRRLSRGDEDPALASLATEESLPLPGMLRRLGARRIP